MSRTRIDKINSLGRLLINLLCIALYFVFAELVFKFTLLNGIHSDLDYYLSLTFSDEERDYARRFIEDLNSFGERAVIVPGTILYRYKPAKTSTFTINSFGFRGEEFTKKRDDEYRIVFFGNSKLLGYLVPEENTIPFLVQEKLREHFKDKKKKITVFNFGMEAIDLQRSVEMAKLYYQELEADFVAFYSAVADMDEAYLWGTAGLKPFVEGDTVPEIFRTRHDGGSFKSNLLHILYSSFVNDFYKFETTSAQHDLMNYPIPPLQIQFLKDFPPTYAERVAKTSIYFQERNIPSLFILPPIVQSKNPVSALETNHMFQREFYAPGVNNFTKKCYDATIREVMRLPGVNVADHSGIFDGTEETVFFDGLHLTPGAIRISAEKIAGEMIKTLESGHFLDKE